MFDREKPYNALPPLTSASAPETIPVLKALLKARVALERLRQAGRSVPNQHLVLQTLGLREAKASAEIENIVTTGDEIYKASRTDDEAASPGVKEVLRYRDALWRGVTAIRANRSPFDLGLVEELYRIVKSAGPDDGIRRVSVFVGSRTYGAVYTPPEGEAVLREKLEALEAFVRGPATDMDPLVRVALAHYQFEAIHPFTDGNGRVGRILAVLQLMAEGLLDEPVIYLSGYILDTKSEYYGRLLDVTAKDDREGWVLYFLKVVEKSAEDATRVIDNIGIGVDFFAKNMQEKLRGIYSRELVELAFTNCYLRPADLEKAGIVKKSAAYTYLQKMAAAGLLVEEGVGKRKLFVNRRLLDAISH